MKKERSLHSDSNRDIMNVDTGGQRNAVTLTYEQLNACKEYAVSLGMPDSRIGYSDNYWTSYNPDLDILLIGTDAYPGINATTANGRLSYKCAVAHEIVGHREAFLRGITSFVKGDVRDEAQASIRAARFAPGLSSVERISLIRDGLERLHRAGYNINDIRDVLDILER